MKNPENNKLSPALEDYLEAIAILVSEQKVARVRDIASRLDVHKSSVSSALKSLSERKLVNYSPYSVVTLTTEGEQRAKEIRQRHRVIQHFLEDILSVNHETAKDNACRMEHVMDREVLGRLALFAEFARQCPRTGDDWLKQFQYFFEHNGQTPHNLDQMKRCIEKLQKKVQEQNTPEHEANT